MTNNEEDYISPLDSAKYVMVNAKHVKIGDEGVKRLANMTYNALNDKNCGYFDYKNQKMHPKIANESTINWIFVVDTLNFSFWSTTNTKEKRYEVFYKNEYHNGYWALCAAINRAIDEGYPITDSKYYSNISESDLRHILRSDSLAEIPLLEERLRILRETGKILQEKFGGNFVNCVNLANKNAKQMLKIIVDNFPSYKDEAFYMGKKVTFYKRAQILVADIWGCFEGHSLGEFSGIDEITMFADYRVPQVLRYFKAIEYSSELDTFLKSNELMKTGDLFEVEIRAGSILACNLINKLVNEMLKKDPNLSNLHVNDILVDYFIWNYRRDYADEIESFLPCHKIRCIYY